MKEKIIKICPCGKNVSSTPSQAASGRGKYCSRKCFYQYFDRYDVSQLSLKAKGEKHWNRKVDAKYAALHLRVQQVRGKAEICEDCGADFWVEWANKTGKYDDVEDYKALCRKCHNKFDAPNKKRNITLGKRKLSEIASKGWETRRTLVSGEVMPR